MFLANECTTALQNKADFLNKLSETARSLADAVETLADASASLELYKEELELDLEGDEEGNVDEEAVAKSKADVAEKEAEFTKALLKVELLEARLRNFKGDVAKLETDIKSVVPATFLPKN